ncbi:MAG: hypothetical protein V7L13_19865 [Nostoc sp.]|uniref:hypothetical protein n=1 Tax=Nostoc sp. TaxID=1180 RepID=UPI002FF8165F
MAEVTFADPTTTRTPLHFDVIPPIKQASPIVTTAPTPTREPFNVQQDAPGQLSRPIDYHGQPKNIPDVQQQIREDGANWKTIDIKPNNTATPSPRTSNTTASVMAGTNVVSGNNFAQEQAFEQAAYYGGWALAGFWDGAIEGKNYPNEALRYKREFAEDGAYAIGQKVGDSVRNVGTDIKDNLENLWKDRPRFEIPNIQIPKFNRPEFPDFKIPKIPEFDIPPRPKDKPIPGQPKPTIDEPKEEPLPTPKEIEIPKPIKKKPIRIPKSLRRRLTDLDLSPCGSVSFSIVYTSKLLGFIYDPVINGDRPLYVPCSTEEILSIAQKVYGDIDIAEFSESGGGTGGQSTISMGENSSYTIYYEVGNAINSNGSSPYYGYVYPVYFATPANISVNGLNTKTAIGSILDKLSNTPTATMEVFRISVSNPGGECPIPKPGDPPIPKPDPPPPPDPPEDCDCMAKCCPDIDYRKIQAIIEDAVKKLDVTAAIPLSFQIRHEGDTPQMVIQCAERKSAASGNTPARYDSAKYPITVPHWKGGQSDKPSIPPYKKGNWEGILVLKDNSKITINAQSESECKKVLNAIKPWIKSDMLEGSYFKGGLIVTDEPIKQIQVYPKYGRYFGKGQKNNKPDWRVDFT